MAGPLTGQADVMGSVWVSCWFWYVGCCLLGSQGMQHSAWISDFGRGLVLRLWQGLGSQTLAGACFKASGVTVQWYQGLYWIFRLCLAVCLLKLNVYCGQQHWMEGFCGCNVLEVRMADNVAGVPSMVTVAGQLGGDGAMGSSMQT